AGETPQGKWGVGHGHTLYGELVKVPLLIVPAGSQFARHDNALVSVADVFTTALALAAVQPPSSSPSRNLLLADAQPRPSVLSESIAYGSPRFAVTTPTLRAIRTLPGRLSVFDRRA